MDTIYRTIVKVGTHRADGTTVTFECGHTTTYNPQFDCSKLPGTPRPCYRCTDGEKPTR